MANHNLRIDNRIDFRELISAVLLFAVLPNIFFIMCSQYFDLSRPWLNLDYAVTAVIFAMRWRSAGVVLAALVFLIDLLQVVGQIYLFLRIQDIGYLIGMLPQASGFIQALAVLSVLCLALMLLVLVRFGGRVSLLPAILLLNASLFVHGLHIYSDVLSRVGLNTASAKSLVNSQSLAFINFRFGGFIQSFGMTGEPFHNTGYRGRTAQWVSEPVEALNPKLLLIVAESWGSFQSEPVQAALLEPIYSRREKFESLQQGEISFAGATVAAELRELCGLWPNHFNLKSVEKGFGECLPARLRAAGYETVAVHGAVGLMYDRVFWYPRVGFDELNFMESGRWRSRCYSFPGVCDREIANTYIRHAFSGPEKRFVYWLTLNSHSIYDSRDLHDDFLECSDVGLPSSGEVCRMAKLHAQFFSGLGEILDDPAMAGVEILVVGDHEPPLMSGSARETYIKKGTVPWLHLRIKDAKVVVGMNEELEEEKGDNVHAL